MYVLILVRPASTVVDLHEQLDKLRAAPTFKQQEFFEI